MNSYQYIGSELELFQEATHWKDYFHHVICKYLGETVIEVGAGIGGTTKALHRKAHQRWLCLEPDENLLSQFKADREVPQDCEVLQGTIQDLSAEERFDSILYIDVLEHIEADRSELQQASQYLNPGGFLIVLGPAHPWLFSPFDQAIGHYRRYTQASLSQLSPPGLSLMEIKYLDSVGLLASLSNRYLRQSMPTREQIKLWDSWMVPLSRWVDPLTRYRFGKSVLCVWRKPVMS